MLDRRRADSASKIKCTVTVTLAVDEAELAQRRKAMEAKGAQAWKPAERARKVSTALKAYAAFASSAARGAVRVVKD